MRMVLNITLVALLVIGLTACGNRGKLKSPAQIQHEQEKKARKEAHAAAKKAEEEKSAEPAPATLPPPEATDEVQGVTKASDK